VQYNTTGWACLDSNAGEMKLGLYNKDVYFVCDGNAWREAKTDEELSCRNDGLCVACTENSQGLFWKHEGNQLVCDEKTWRAPNCAEIATESLCTANDSAVVWECEDLGNFKIDYICSQDPDQNKKLVWHPVRHPFEYTLADWSKKKAEYYTAAKHPNATYGSDFTDPRDGNVYKTVVINGFRMFAENLRYVDSSASVNLKGQTMCYDNKSRNCDIGGALYTWAAAHDLDQKWNNAESSSLIGMQHRGICPDGWHVPSSQEFVLTIGDAKASQMRGFSVFGEATDASGFSAMPGRVLDEYGWGEFSYGYAEARFWTNDEGDGYGAPGWWISYGGSGEPDRYALYALKRNLYSIRCFENYAGAQPIYLYKNDSRLNQWKSLYYSSETNPDAAYADDLVDERDGNVYKTVIIDGKRWMAENLRYADTLSTPNLKEEIGIGLTPVVYGIAYSWLATMNLAEMDHHPSSPQGVCPNGWHIPDTTEWRALENFAGTAASLQMKYQTTVKNATDRIGFSAVYTAYYDFGDLSFRVPNFWLSTAHRDFDDGYYAEIGVDKIEVKNSAVRDLRYIRCVEDDPVEP